MSSAVQQAGGRAMLTRKDHPTGTDRLAEVAAAHPEAELIINVQGDEPLIEPALIDALAAAFDDDPELQMATVRTEITDEAEQQNPNNVKVVTDKQGYALYFSRSLLPFPRHTGTPVYKHIGIYAYKRDFLLQYAKMAETPTVCHPGLPRAGIQRPDQSKEARTWQTGGHHAELPGRRQAHHKLFCSWA